MSTSHKEKIIRVLQLFQTTDEKTPMNAVQISQKLEEEAKDIEGAIADMQASDKGAGGLFN